MPICIAGMHRTGTSMVARLLNLCGLYLGPETELMHPQPDNPEGFWENIYLTGLNDEILAELGGAWDLPPDLPAGWQLQPGMMRLRTKAEQILVRFKDHEIWGWKDPRSSLTLPFWQSLIPDLQVVICVRNPIEVAESMTKRGASSHPLAFRLWLAYYQCLLPVVRPEARVVTHYDAYFQDPRPELRRVVSRLQMTVPDAVIDRACSFVSPTLHHFRVSGEQLLEAQVPSEVLGLYMDLSAEAGRMDQLWAKPETVDQPESVSSDDSSHRDHLDAMRGSQMQALKVQLARREQQLREIQDHLARLRDELWDRNTEIVRLRGHEAELAWLREEIRRMQATRVWRLGQVYWGLHAKLASRLRSRSEALSSKAESRETSSVPAEPTRPTQPQSVARTLARKHFTGPESTSRIRNLVRSIVPAGASLLVASESDRESLKSEGFQTLPFPLGIDGFAASTPTNSTSAIVKLEVARVEGAGFLLLPSEVLQLARFSEFKRHLDHQYRLLSVDEDDDLLCSLQEHPLSGQAKIQREFEGVVAEFEIRFGRQPDVLDLYPGLDLAAAFPGLNIFAPATTDPALPYVDHSIDLIVTTSSDGKALEEARRVAKGAIVRIMPPRDSNNQPAQGNPSAGLSVDVEWQSSGDEQLWQSFSIIIPCHNNAHRTETCLLALAETVPEFAKSEIIVVDDASTDETADLLRKRAQQDSRLKILRNETNAGFVESCNRGARAAEGEMLIFLNNDTLPLPAWWSAMLRTFRDHPDAGAIGAKLILPDGTLQEAGGLVFEDGSAANFGRGDANPEAPLYNYVREVDYCSAACLATPRQLFLDLGGFDASYAPAYYEDTDYCFQVRQRTRRVYYQPEAAIIHFEGTSSGTDLSSGAKRFQLVNQSKFFEKWQQVLKKQRPRPDRFDEVAWNRFAVRA